jgi:IclR family transcriptional regulator, acetate operon repressor
MSSIDWDKSSAMLPRLSAILDCLAQSDGVRGVSAIAADIGLPKSTVSRLINDLVEHRYLERVRGGVRLGLRLFELGQRARGPRELRDIALTSMADLRQATGRTVQLAVLEGADVVYIGILRGDPRHSAPQRGEVGGRLPAHATALGKALLAFSAPEVLSAVLQSPLQSFTPNTITRPAVLKSQLADIRETGVSYQFEESGPGLTAVGSPILTPWHSAFAAISISGRVGEFAPQQVASAVRATALAIGRQIPQAHDQHSWTEQLLSR